MEPARILIVEDEGITAMDIKGRLTMLGYDVVAVAGSGESALRLTADVRPDLVLMDIHLGSGMDGIQAADTVRRQFDIPVIYLTAYTDDETLTRASLTEPFGYLLKPFEQRELHSTIAMALQKHKSEAALRESERQLRLYANRLSTLHEIDRATLTMDTAVPEAVAGEALRRIHALVPCRQASVATFDWNTRQVSLLAVYPPGSARANSENHGTLAQVIGLDALRAGQPLVVDDLLTFQTHRPMEQMLVASGLRSYAVSPLMADNELLGALTLYTDVPGAYGPESLEIVHEVANSLALAIHHARTHQQVERHAAELEERNQELDAFAHTVAHEIKSPLAVMYGFADVLLDELDSLTESDLRTGLHIMAQTTAKMDNIVQELLLLSSVRKQDVTIMPLDMAHVVESACRRLKHTIDAQQAEIVVPSALAWPRALGHAPWIEEVWVNYLSNAFKYGGHPPRAELGAAAQPGGQVCFWVRDNGPGISPEMQGALFAPFTRLNQVRAEGQGLGLSIVRRIVEKLGGQVGVESSGVPGQGSTFRFTLPAAD